MHRLATDSDLSFGVSCANMTPEGFRPLVEHIDRLGFEVFWAGDHVEAPFPIMEPLMQLAQAAVLCPELTVGTGIYLLPLRHPVPVAKQVATLDLLTGGRLIFGVGIGGEFPNEYAACGVSPSERGARLDEALPILRRLWSGPADAHQGRFFELPPVHLQPGPARPGGPPVWCAGRADAALARIGRLGDGWLAYVVTPEMFAQGLGKIMAAAEAAGRELTRVGTGVMLFARIEDDYEHALDIAAADLSERYAMDFRRPAARYAALGRPADVARTIDGFRAAGVRHISLDMAGPPESRFEQYSRFAEEVRPLL